MPDKPTYEQLEKRIRQLERAEATPCAAEKALNEAPLPFQLLDENGKIIWVNQSWLDTLGYSLEEVAGRNFQDFINPDRIGHFKEKFSRFKAAGEVLGLELEMVKKDGSSILVAFNGKISRAPKQEFRHAHCILHKITERQRAGEDFKRFFDLTPDLACIASTSGYFLKLNQAWRATLGFSEEELLTTPFMDFIHPDDRASTMAEVERQLSGCATINFVNRYRCKDGSYKWLEWQATPAVDQTLLFASARDITDRKNYENRLRWSLRRNTLLSETAARLLQSDDPQSLVEDICRQVMEFIDCQAFFNFLEAPRQGKLHLNACAGIPEHEAEKIEWLEHGVAVCGCVAQNHQRMICEDIQNRDDVLTNLVKSYGIQAYCCHPLMIQDRLIGTLSFGRRSHPCFEQKEIDLMASISNLVAVAMNRMEMENMLRDSESRFKMFAELAPLGIVISDENENTIFVNQRFTELFGYTIEDMPSVRQWWELAYPDELLRAKIREEWQEAVGEARRTHSEISPMEYPVTCKDGKVRHIEFRMATNGNLNVVLFTDITERKQAEEQRQEGFQLLHNLARLVPGVIYQYRLYPDGRSAFPYSSPGMYDIYEVTPEEVREDASVVFGRLHPEDYGRVAETIFESARTLKPFYCELRVILPEKGLGWRWSQAHPERMEDGGTLWHGIILDITERKQAEQASREQEERLRAIFDSTQDVIYLKDTDLRYTHCNAAMERLFGHSRDQIIGRTDAELFAMEDAKEIVAMDRQVLAGRSARGTYKRTINGESRMFDTSKSPVLDATGNVVGFCGVTRDITEEVNLREQMRQAQKVEAIGRLAGGVAHDLNNLLSPVIGYGEMLLEELSAGDSRGEMADGIVRAGVRARDIVRQLLAFSRKQVMDFKALDVNATIRGFKKLLRRTIPEDIRMETILSPDIQPVMADVGQIEQILMNLAVNAADAMPDGGRLSIETASVELDEAYAATRPEVQPGAYIMIAVSDTGCGMDKETSEHIFEPFFSTKGERGTGLGLATVFGIVKQHVGNIWVYSEPGKGTTFKIYLPVAEKAVLEDKPVSKKHADLKGTETIMLVEDNDQVRELARAILKRQGYRVLVAMNGEEAMQTLAANGGPVHLLLTDVVMPGMNGRVLYEKAAQQHPEMKVLYMSGYTDNVIAHRGVLDQGVQFIQKPFSVKRLAVKVREVLELD